MKKIIFLTLLTLTGSVFADSCREGFSVGMMKKAYSEGRLVTGRVSEVRGSGLFYAMTLEISLAKKVEKQSAANTTSLELFLPANDQTGDFLESIVETFETKKVVAFCVKQGSHYAPELPAIFDIAFGELLELDEVQPFAK